MKNGKFYFPGGHPPVVDGKFVSNAEDCCCGCVCLQDPSDFTKFSSCSKLHWGFFTAAQWDEAAPAPNYSGGETPAAAAAAADNRFCYTHPYGYKAAAMIPLSLSFVHGEAVRWKQTTPVDESIPSRLALEAGLLDEAQTIEIRYDDGNWYRRNFDADSWYLIGPGDRFGTFVQRSTLPTICHGLAIEFVNVVRNNDCDGDPGGDCKLLDDGDVTGTHIISTTSKVICFSVVNTHNEVDDPTAGWIFNPDSTAQTASSSAFVTAGLSDELTPTDGPPDWRNIGGTILFDYYLSGADPTDVTSPTSSAATPFAVVQSFNATAFTDSPLTMSMPLAGSAWFGNFTRGALDSGAETVVIPGGGGMDDHGNPIDTREITDWLRLVFIWNNNHCWTLT